MNSKCATNHLVLQRMDYNIDSTYEFIEGSAMDKGLHEEVYTMIKENMEDLCNQSNFPWNDAMESRNHE